MGERDGEFRERLQGLESGRRRRRRTLARGAAAFEDLRGVARTDGVFVLERNLADLVTDDTERGLEARIERTGRSVPARDDLADELQTLLRNPSGALFVDTETTGLAGSVVFLLGAMRVVDGRIALTQIFARDYREEPALLDAWTAMLRRAKMLVSFNGKAFDLPVLRDRLGLHGIESPPEPPHVDLLHHSRRAWRGVLPDCRLQTIEWRVCGRRRVGDIPGGEIPAVYHRFVRTGDPTDILSVFHHNALDLITLADIALALAGSGSDPS